MPIPTTSNTKTVTTSVSPALTATLLTSLLAEPIELLTISQLDSILSATKRGPNGSNPNALIGACLP